MRSECDCRKSSSCRPPLMAPILTSPTEVKDFRLTFSRIFMNAFKALSLWGVKGKGFTSVSDPDCLRRWTRSNQTTARFSKPHCPTHSNSTPHG